MADYTDGFTGTEDPLTTPWVQVQGNGTDRCLKTGGVALPASDVGNNSAYRYNNTFTDDQYSKVKIVALSGASGFVAVCVRMASGASSYYGLFVKSDHWYLIKLINGTETSLANGAGTFVANDVIELRVTGNNLVAKQNTTTLTTTASGGELTTGQAGIGGSTDAGSSAQMDDWSGGDLAAAGPSIFPNLPMRCPRRGGPPHPAYSD